MRSYSNSKLSTFEQCRLKYKFAYIDRVEVEFQDTVEAFLGSMVHETLEKLYKDLKFEKQNSLQDLIDYFNKLWKENWNETILIVKEDYKEDNYRMMGEKMITDYYNKHHPFKEGKILGLETTEFLDLGEGYQWHIRIDRFMDAGDGVYEVHDYKTGNYLLKQEDADSDRQLAMYSLWVRKKFADAKEVKLIWHYLFFDRDIISTRSLKELWTLKKEVLQKIKELEKEKDFPPNKSSLCNWCAYQDICPLWKHQAELEKKEENEFLSDDGVKLVNEYVLAKAEEKELTEKMEKKIEKIKEAIIALAKKKGVDVLFGSDNKIKITNFKSISLPHKGTKEREYLVEFLKSIGRYEELLDLDANALKKVITDEEYEPAIIKKLEEFAKIKENSMLKVSKIE